MDEALRAAQTALQSAQARRNEASKQIGQVKAARDEDRAGALMAEVDSLKAAIAQHGETETTIGGQLHDLLSSLPNRPAPDTPSGADENRKCRGPPAWRAVRAGARRRPRRSGRGARA